MMLCATGFWCDVTPFHDSYSPKADIKIVQLATRYQHDNGIVYFLFMGEYLWFGKAMEHSLFIGLIVKDAGVNLRTDP
jgi:hypothetical protein